MTPGECSNKAVFPRRSNKVERRRVIISKKLKWHVKIYIIISKNIRYLLWNRGVWRFFHGAYLTIEVQGIRCTHHLNHSCPLTDVNPQFTAPGCRYYFKINSWWPIVTSSTHGPAARLLWRHNEPLFPRYLWTHDVEVDASYRDCLRSPELCGTWLHNFAYRGTCTIIFGLPCFNTGH